MQNRIELQYLNVRKSNCSTTFQQIALFIGHFKINVREIIPLQNEIFKKEMETEKVHRKEKNEIFKYQN